MAKAHQKIGPYELIKRLGSGGNGEVWRARGPEREVAIKLLKKPNQAPPDAVARFRREIEALQRLRDVAGILPLLDFDSGKGRWYTMPVASPLSRKLGKDPSLPRICEAFSGVADALARAHSLGVVHRDIKPDNLFWHDGHWCLGDFGLADFTGAKPLTRNGRKLGPAFFIAPEMVTGASTADGRHADVYSLGKAIWAVATGQNFPWPSALDPTYPPSMIQPYRTEPETSLLDELVRKMTHHDPSRRPTADSVSRELAIIARDESTTAPPDPTSALARLRAAAAGHFARVNEEEHRKKLCDATKKKFEDAIYRLVQSIRRESGGFSPQPWFTVPKFWGVPSELGSVTFEDIAAYAVEGGGRYLTWRLVIGVKLQVVGADQLHVTVGYHFDRLINGEEQNLLGDGRVWRKRGTAVNGAPSSDELADTLIAGLEEKFPDIIDAFARLVSEAAAGG